MKFDEFVKEHQDKGYYYIFVEDTRKGHDNIGNTNYDRIPVFMSGSGVIIQWANGKHPYGFSSAYRKAEEDFPLSFSPHEGNYDPKTDMYHLDIKNFKLTISIEP